MKRAIGYVRVSTDKQADSGVSLAAQEVKVRTMAMLHDDWHLTQVIEDAGESASTLDRPGMLQLLSMVARREVNVVIIAKLDRITRSVKDLATLLETLDKYGVTLVSVADSLDTGTASGRLVLNIMMSVSQWEREVIGERTRAAMAHKKNLHERVGTIPYGFRLSADATHIEPDDYEQVILGRIACLRREGHPFPVIADRLNANHFTTRSGTSWDRRYLAKLAKKVGGK